MMKNLYCSEMLFLVPWKVIPVQTLCSFFDQVLTALETFALKVLPGAFCGERLLLMQADAYFWFMPGMTSNQYLITMTGACCAACSSPHKHPTPSPKLWQSLIRLINQISSCRYCRPFWWLLGRRLIFTPLKMLMMESGVTQQRPSMSQVPPAAARRWCVQASAHGNHANSQLECSPCRCRGRTSRQGPTIAGGQL